MQTTGLQRTLKDKFYTSPEVAHACVEWLRPFVANGDLVIDPSAGSGAFIDGIETLCDNTWFFDLEPAHASVQQLDFFNFEPPPTSTERKVHVFTNPPYGRQSSLARRFIRKSAQFADTIAFILPKSFKKQSMQVSFPACFHLELQEDLPDNAFLVEGRAHDVPSVFQIWVKKSQSRDIPSTAQPVGYCFLRTPEGANLSFRRVGWRAGETTVLRSPEEGMEKSVQSHYFLRFGRNPTKRFEEKCNALVFEHDNTVGAKSISKRQLIPELNKLMTLEN